MTVLACRRESFNAGHNYILEAVVAGRRLAPAGAVPARPGQPRELDAAVSVCALSRTRVTARVKGQECHRRGHEGVHAASGPLPDSEEGTA